MDVPQAALPDLNTQWIIAVREFWTALRSKNYPMLFGALYNINALLPDNYQIEISDKKYFDEVNKQGISLICKYCSAETKRQDIKIKEVLTTYSVSILTGHKNEKVWYCDKCHKDNILSQAKMINNVLPQPCYLKVVPNPPIRKSDLSDRQQYHRNVERWGLQALNELQHQMSLFRLEYKPKDDENFEDNEFMNEEETKLEEFS